MKHLAYTSYLQGIIRIPHYGTNEAIIDDISKKYMNGVFIIHKVSKDIVGTEADTWNTSLDKENWETFIANEWPQPVMEE